MDPLFLKRLHSNFYRVLCAVCVVAGSLAIIFLFFNDNSIFHYKKDAASLVTSHPAQDTQRPPLLLDPEDLSRTCLFEEDYIKRQKCAEDWFRSHGGAEDISIAISTVHSLYSAGKINIDECHALEHGVTRVTLESGPDDIAAILATCNAEWSCDGGCYHGVMERAIVRVGLSDEGLKTLGQLCVTGGQNFMIQCFHGMGHGFVFVSAYNLFDSLSYCDKAISEPFQQAQCYSGVYMEAARPNVTGNNPPYFHPDDPLYPCLEVPEKYKLSCYADVGQRARSAGQSIEGASSICARIPLKQGIEQCYGQLYGGIARLEEKVSEKQRLCKTFGIYARECFSTVARDLAVVLNDKEELLLFCSGLARDLEQACKEGGSQ